MAAEFIVLLGDNPHRLDSETPYQGRFSFDQDLPPNTSKPSHLIISVQGLVEPTNVFLNNTLVGKLTPTLNYVINNTLTSPKYANQSIRVNKSPTWVPVPDFLSDVVFATTTTTDEFYWSTQTINVGAKDSTGPESGESVLFPKNQWTDNKLLIERVSQPFLIKNIVLFYHIED
ncbi:hypothetical protein [Crocosphaera sp.]|uniref:hypothetical protein n=1 Tax=Crocosphaera sp. TaxID=2729996 RepID=UPI003F27200C|nr:hypothetical protein [Crocosphaera sp.]